MAASLGTEKDGMRKECVGGCGWVVFVTDIGTPICYFCQKRMYEEELYKHKKRSS
jgi:hypothetical protein